MGYYIFVFTITTLLGFVYDNQRQSGGINKTQNRWILSLLFVTYVVFVGCRGYNVGSDTPAYVFMLDNASQMQYVDYLQSNLFIEPFFHSVLWASIHIIKTPSFFFIINAILYFAVFIRFSAENSKSLGWSVWLINSMGFATMALSTLRQSMAMAFCLLAYVYLEKNRVKSWLFFLMAFGSHISSCIFLPMLFLNWFKKKNIPTYIIILIIVAFVLGPFIISRAAFEYESVTGKYGQELITTSEVGGIGMIVFLVTILFMGLKTYLPVRRGLILIYANEVFAVGMALVVFVIARVNVAVIRLYWYYLPFIIIFIPNVFYNMKPLSRNTWKSFIVVITMYYLVTQVMASPYEESKLLLPYYFFWKDSIVF